MRNKVRILLGMVLGTALLAPSAPSAAGDGERGGKIVFSRLVSGVLGAGNTELFVMNVDGSGVTQLTHSPYGDIEPAWSPDGSQVAFRATGTATLRSTSSAPTGPARPGSPSTQPGTVTRPGRPTGGSSSRATGTATVRSTS